VQQFLRSVLVGMLCTALVPCFAQTTDTKQFSLQNHGQLQLTMPGSWQAEMHQPLPELPPTISVTPTSGAAFQILITPVWPLRSGALLPDLGSVRHEVAASADKLAPQSVEKALSVRQLGSDGNQGFYFSATDSAPKPGEFKYLTQGIAHVGDINLAFTILTNDGQETVVKDALDMIRRASQRML
jgi:hypothetical protein